MERIAIVGAGAWGTALSTVAGGPVIKCVDELMIRPLRNEFEEARLWTR